MKPYICVALPSKAIVLAFVSTGGSALEHPIGNLKELPIAYQGYQRDLRELAPFDLVRDRLVHEWQKAVEDRNRLLLNGF